MNVVTIVPTGIGCEIGGHCGDGRRPTGRGDHIIALQMHPGPPMKVEFKNIRLKGL